MARFMYADRLISKRRAARSTSAIHASGIGPTLTATLGNGFLRRRFLGGIVNAVEWENFLLKSNSDPVTPILY